MRSFIFYALGFCCLAALPAFAQQLPTNPWLHSETGGVKLRSNNGASADNTAAQTARLTQSINEQFDNSQTQLMQIINESLPEQERRPSASQQMNLPSWQELMPQIDINAMLPKSSGNIAKATQPASSPAKSFSSGTDELARTLADIERKYNKAKRTSNAYYNQAKNGIKKLENEAENSVNQIQKMLKQ
jgi:hypothetical protein